MTLRGNGAFVRLWSARAISTFGDSLTLVALLLYVAGAGGQVFAVAALLLAGDVAPAVFGPLTGVLGDRFDRRRVMIGCELVQAGAVLAILLTLPPLPILLGLVGVRALAAHVLAPAAGAAVPGVVPDELLERANSAVGVGANGTEALGPLAAAVLLPLLGIRGVLLVDVASFVVSAVLLAFLPALRTAPEPDAEPGVIAAARAGLRHVRRVPLVRAVVLGFVAVVACTGVDDVALVFLGRDALHAGDAGTALLYGGVGVGLLVGFAVLARHGAGRPLLVLAIAGFALSSLGNLLTGLAWAVGVAFAFQVVRGIGISAIDVGVTTFLQRTVPAGLLGRVLGCLYAGLGIAAGCSYLLGALLLAFTDARTTFVVAGAGGLLATAVTALAVRRAVRPGPADPT